jgi:hypothetical protein
MSPNFPDVTLTGQRLVDRQVGLRRRGLGFFHLQAKKIQSKALATKKVEHFAGHVQCFDHWITVRALWLATMHQQHPGGGQFSPSLKRYNILYITFG